MDILQMAMDAERGRLEAEAMIAILAPQVEALHRTPVFALFIQFFNRLKIQLVEFRAAR
jgi:hypothetical protein